MRVRSVESEFADELLQRSPNLHWLPREGIEVGQADGSQAEARAIRARRPIELVAHNRVARLGQVQPDLVSPPRQRMRFDERGFSNILEHPKSGFRCSAMC